MDGLKDKEKMRVILLPTEKAENGCLLMGLAEYGWANEDRLYYLSRINEEVYNYSDSKYDMSASLTDLIPTVLNPRHIYVVSNREIKLGSVVLHERGYIGMVTAIGYNDAAEVEIGWFGKQKDYTAARTSLKYLKRIEASTDKSLGLPSVSEEFILAYVKQFNLGTPIEEVNVQMEILPEKELMKFPEYPFTEGPKCFRLKTDRDNTITITKVVDTWEDIKEEFDKHFHNSYPSFVDRTFRWLAERYSVPKKLK